MEMKTLDEIKTACREIARVLKLGGIFVIVTNNPDAIGCDYVSFKYERPENLKSGDRIPLIVKGEKPFEIEDYYWSEEDTDKILETSGFKIIEKTLPLAKGKGWLDETKVASDMVYKCIKL